MLSVISFVITLFIYRVSGLIVSIEVIPDTVGQDAVMTLMIKPEVSVPKYGGFIVSVPSKFKYYSNGQIQCTVDGDSDVQLYACDTLSEKEV